VDEVKAAIYELAKIHAISWVIQERGEADGGPLFQFAHKELEAAVLYEVSGGRHLRNFIQIFHTIQVSSSSVPFV